MPDEQIMKLTKSIEESELKTRQLEKALLSQTSPKSINSMSNIQTPRGENNYVQNSSSLSESKISIKNENIQIQKKLERALIEREIMCMERED